MIPELGDTNSEVLVNETFHVQTDDELTENELKQIEADDQSIQTILLEKKAKLFNEWERFTSNDGELIESYYHHFLKLMNDLKRNKHFPKKIVSNANQNPNRNGNLVAARAEGNAAGHNGNQIRCYNCRGRLLSATITLFKDRRFYLRIFIKWYQSLVRSFDQQKNNIQAQQKKKMIKKSSSSENEPCCSKDCKKNTETLNKRITDLSNKLFDANNMIFHYKLGLSQVEGRLVEQKEREVKYIKKIRTLEFYNESYKECIETLKKKLETLKQEKEGVDGKLAGLLTASKDLDNLIKSQRSDKNKEGLGYSAVPPPIAQFYLSPKKDLSWTGLPECADDTVTDYSRPSPTVESTLRDDQNRNSSASENGESTDSILSKPAVKFVKAAERPVSYRPYRPLVRPIRSNMNDARPNRTTFNKQVHSYTNRLFQRTSAVRPQYRAPWVPTVNKNFPPVNRKLPTDAASSLGEDCWELNDQGIPTAKQKILSQNFHQKSSTQTDKAPVYDSDVSVENDNNVISEVTSMEESGGTVEQHPTNVEETRALYDSLYHNLAIEVEKVNTVNRKLKETNAELATELARFKNQEKCFEISQEKYDKLERCYQKSVYQQQCHSKKINALYLSFNELLDKQIQLEKRIKELDNILVKMGQSIQTIHMLLPKPDSFYHTEQKMALDYQNPFYLKQAQKKQQSLYDGKVLLEKHDPPVVHDSEEKLQLAQETKFVGEFNSLAKEADESLAKQKALELEIKRFLRAVVSQDIMSVVQKASVVDTSNLQTELERTKECFENYIIKKENEYAKLWNDWYKKCEEYKFDKISYDKAYDMQQKIEWLQAQLGDLKGKRIDNTKTKRSQLKSNTKNDRVSSASKSSCNKNKRVEVEEHHKNLSFSKNKKHMSSACNNINLDSHNVISKVVCAMCKQYLISVNHDKFMGTVRFRNDHVAAILGFDDLQWGNILITRVYFVKGLGHNLFSIGKFCDSDLEVAFRRNTCFVRNLEGVDLLKGNRTTNLYTINLYDMDFASPICLMARASFTKSWLWHQREHLCPSCEQGKSKRASNPPKPVPNSRQRLHLLHMDLCGPMRIASINGKRTKKIMERKNVSFDELLAMAFEQRSLKPRLQCKTSRQINSGLDLTYAPSTITIQQPTKGELDLLFEAVYDDYIGGQPSADLRSVLAAQAHQICQTLMESTSIADTAPIPTNSSSQATNFPSTLQDVDRLKTQQQQTQQQGNQASLQSKNVANNVSNAMFDANTFVNPFATSSTSAAKSSLKNMDPSNMHTFELTGFSDADYVGCKDTFKSTSGGAQFLGEKLLTNYGFHFNNIPIYCDLKSAIAISCNPIQHSRTKHIVVRCHFIKEHVEKGTIELYFVKTDYQLADLFTKALLADRFNYLVYLLGMRILSPQEVNHLAKSQ
nr:retrovirus-related Pol polyprotein from transposon TNT 1-94 [Tanacetum cinerariifolium]